jgi:hypothetical protein
MQMVVGATVAVVTIVHHVVTARIGYVVAVPAAVVVAMASNAIG